MYTVDRITEGGKSMDTKILKRRALNNLEGNWALSVGVAFLAALLGGVSLSNSFNLNINEDVLQNLPPILWKLLAMYASVMGLLGLARFIIGGTINLGYTQYLLDQHDRRELDFHVLFSQFNRFGVGFLQFFLRDLYIALWSLLFIIPGIVKTYSYAMTPYILADHPEMTANEAITASRQLMDGHKGELFWLHLTFIGWGFLCIFTLGIGHLFLNPYMNAAEAAFYRQLTDNNLADKYLNAEYV